MKVDLSEDEVKAIIDILKYSMDSCPIESVSDRVSITADQLQEIVAKLEKPAKVV